MLANGDWTRRDQVQLITPPGPAVDEEQAKQQVVQGLMKVLAGRLLRLYPQHRWLGAEAAVVDESCHHLASTAFQHMMSGMQHPIADGEAAELGPEVLGVEALEASRQEAEATTGEAALEREEGTAAPPPHELQATAPDPHDQAQSSATWQAINHQRACVARDWLSSNPLAHLRL